MGGVGRPRSYKSCDAIVSGVWGAYDHTIREGGCHGRTTTCIKAIQEEGTIDIQWWGSLSYKRRAPRLYQRCGDMAIYEGSEIAIQEVVGQYGHT